MKEKIMRFFWGRYGVDPLGYGIIIFSMALSFASSLLKEASSAASYILWLFSYLLLGWEIFRMLSRNISARRVENDKFLRVWKPAKKWGKLQYNRIKDIKTHRYFSCPNCKNNLRVPKGRGTITITCPVCKIKFDRRS